MGKKTCLLFLFLASYMFTVCLMLLLFGRFLQFHHLQSIRWVNEILLVVLMALIPVLSIEYLALCTVRPKHYGRAIERRPRTIREG